LTERSRDAVTFEGVRRAQLREQMRLTPGERLRWLEDALRFAAMAQRRASRPVDGRRIEVTKETPMVHAEKRRISLSSFETREVRRAASPFR
jgi:hypothetical protein